MNVQPEPPTAGTSVLTIEELIARAAALAASGTRQVLGIAGAPGSGKSTVADALAGALPDLVALVPMDGYHLADSELERLGLRDRKGAADTFDVAAYVELLARLADPGPDDIRAPRFDRSVEASVPDDIRVPTGVPLVVTEGNYLLLDQGPWAGIRPLLDEAWYLHTDDELRVARLIARHERFGKAPEAARECALGSDQRNADLVAASRSRADLVIRLR